MRERRTEGNSRARSSLAVEDSLRLGGRGRVGGSSQPISNHRTGFQQVYPEPWPQNTPKTRRYGSLFMDQGGTGFQSLFAWAPLCRCRAQLATGSSPDPHTSPQDNQFLPSLPSFCNTLPHAEGTVTSLAAIPVSQPLPSHLALEHSRPFLGTKAGGANI